MAVKSLSLSLTHLRPILKPSSRTLSILRKTHFPKSHLLQPKSFSTTATPYPLQYDLILRRPAPSQTRRQTPKAIVSDDPSDSEKPDVELSLDGWVDHKLASEKKIDRPISGIGEMDRPSSGIGLIGDMDRSKRKYYNKRRKRMYGSDSDGDRQSEEGSVELVPEVVEFDRLHKREEELYFYDAFAYPWEKDKHYRMVYELEKKYFPDQGMDKAFLEPGASNEDNVGVKGKVKKLSSKYKGGGVGDERLVFFEEEGEEKGKKDLSTSVTEKKCFPDQGMDKAFLEPKALSEEGNVGVRGKLRKLASKYTGGGVGTEKGDERLLSFEEEGEEKGKKDLGTGVAQKKVDEIFKWLEKVPGGDNRMSDGEPYLLMRSRELPSKWDGPFGTVVLVNKPKGWTSFTVCGKLRRLVNVKKVGHAGTLDPMATGLLIVCVGKATKLADTYQGMVKGYSGIFRLGEATSTWDADSPVIQRESWEHIRDEDIKKAVASFLGEIWQVPPMFSAIKVKGEKMYDKARRGESIELAPRRISIFEFDFERSMDDRQDLIFRVVCSKGTYIRSLCSDLGKALGSCAHLTALRRDSIGEYSAEDAWEFSELEEAIAKR